MRALVIFPVIAVIGLPVTAVLATFTGDALSALLLELILAVTLAAAVGRAPEAAGHSHPER